MPKAASIFFGGGTHTDLYSTQCSSHTCHAQSIESIPLYTSRRHNKVCELGLKSHSMPTPRSTTTVILRKRKRRSTSDNLVLHCSTSPSPGCEVSESEYGPASFPAEKSVYVPVASSSQPSSSTVDRRYKCTFESCAKAYTKPARLIEHQRTHTGDVCTRLLRETSLH